MRFDRENGKRRPGQGGVPSADQTAKSIEDKSSKRLEVVLPNTDVPDLVVTATGCAGFAISPFAYQEPVGLAIIDINDDLELIVFVSARRKYEVDES